MFNLVDKLLIKKQAVFHLFLWAQALMKINNEFDLKLLNWKSCDNLLEEVAVFLISQTTIFLDLESRDYSVIEAVCKIWGITLPEIAR